MDQKQFWQHESYQYFMRNYHGKNLREIKPPPFIKQLLGQYPIDIQGGSILDIGCGPASNLHFLTKALGAKKSVGIETSEKTVLKLVESYPEYEFITCDAASLPIQTDSFDLVLFRGILSWVDRNYIMQTLGEAIRVCSAYLIVSEYSPQQAYSVKYHHSPMYRTFKINYKPLLEATGFIRCLASFYMHDGDEWKANQTALYRKLTLEEGFPLKTQTDFNT